METTGAKTSTKLAKVRLNERLDGTGFGDPRMAADVLGAPVGS